MSIYSRKKSILILVLVFVIVFSEIGGFQAVVSAQGLPESEKDISKESSFDESLSENQISNAEDFSDDAIALDEIPNDTFDINETNDEIPDIDGFYENVPDKKWAETIDAFHAILTDYDLIALIYNTEAYDVREAPTADSAVVNTIPIGYQVKLLGVEIVENNVWFYASFAVDDIVYQGYIENKNIVTSDYEFMEWKALYGIDQILLSRAMSRSGASSVLSSFPESYRPYIQKLMNAHPNWTFIPYKVGLDWNTVIKNEMYPLRNLVPANSMDSYKSTDPKFYNAAKGTWYLQDSGDWVQASEAAVKYYMDPRNFLNEESIFSFELLAYSVNCKESGVESILKGTFMSKKVLEDNSGNGKTYGKVFMELGKKQKVSPYFLASRIRQEQGANGSALISGKYPGYSGLYNYFNLGASGNTLMEIIINGLTFARNEGWTNRYLSLAGGTTKVSNQYIKRGQDTLYLQKFDVDSSHDGLYWHQYMQNLLAADNEGRSVKKAYASLGILENHFIFKIPVYDNMTSSAAGKPSETPSKPIPTLTKNGYSSVKIDWKKVPGATGYQIYRKTNANGTYKLLKAIKGTTVVSFTDKTILPNRKYYYKVRTYKTVNGKNYYSSYSKALSADNSMKAVTLSSVKIKSKKSAIIKWKKSSHVTGYALYRKTKNGTFKRIKTLKGSSKVSYTDNKTKSKQTYYYRIRAYKTVNGKNYYSPYSKTIKLVMK